MDKIWLKSYPPGVPAEIDWRQHQSVGELFARNCERYSDRPAYHNMGATLSFGELDRLTQHFGAWLQSKGLAKGARFDDLVEALHDRTVSASPSS